MRVRIALSLALGALGACKASAPEPFQPALAGTRPAGRVITGTWGGENAGLIGDDAQRDGERHHRRHDRPPRSGAADPGSGAPDEGLPDLPAKEPVDALAN